MYWSALFLWIRRTAFPSPERFGVSSPQDGTPKAFQQEKPRRTSQPNTCTCVLLCCCFIWGEVFRIRVHSKSRTASTELHLGEMNQNVCCNMWVGEENTSESLEMGARSVTVALHSSGSGLCFPFWKSGNFIWVWLPCFERRLQGLQLLASLVPCDGVGSVLKNGSQIKLHIVKLISEMTPSLRVKCLPTFILGPFVLGQLKY